MPNNADREAPVQSAIHYAQGKMVVGLKTIRILKEGISEGGKGVHLLRRLLAAEEGKFGAYRDMVRELTATEDEVR